MSDLKSKTPSDPPDLREIVARAFEAGALSVHREWLLASERGEGPPRGDPEFGEAANDYAALDGGAGA